MKIQLVLESGESFIGESIGAKVSQVDSLGEIVFNTSMSGYQEVFTDPSYCDQLVVMTYPLIGNYGITKDDFEGKKSYVKAIVIKEDCDDPSNWRNQGSLDSFLKEQNIAGIKDIDTRKLTKLIRSKGTMKAALFPLDTDAKIINEKLNQNLPTDQIPRVSSQKIEFHKAEESNHKVVMMDFGHKKNILSSLLKRGCDVHLVPYNTSFKEIEELAPDGIMLSNGPGDPQDIPEVLPVIQKLQTQYPLFAICMGHQLFALANGAQTIKMKFGHRGANHPVKNFAHDRVYITSQNHSYAVDEKSLKKTPLEVTEVNLNDKSVEGLRHKNLPCFSVQYHPEASPGPKDTEYLFDQFINLMKDKNLCL